MTQNIANCHITFIIIVTHLMLACGYYVNQWAVHIEGGEALARQVVSRHGFILKNQVGSLKDHYVIEHPHILKRSAEKHTDYHVRLKRETEVLWLEQQFAKTRTKRGLIKKRETNYGYKLVDPYWPKMWYLHKGAWNSLDMNVIEAWKKGYSGKGIAVSILDDGIEKNHPDLQENYYAKASYDYNNHDSDPQPRYDPTNENKHGTRCAGEVASVANNSLCGTGVAFHAWIGGVRMLDGDVTDSVEASSLSLAPQHIDIYSASWGPDDNGQVVDGPAILAKKAFHDGVTKGRGGKGSIYVWASGNGGINQDSCNCDGYTNSIYTLSVSSVSENGRKPWYLEECSSTIATTYSSGDNYREKKILTTDLNLGCTGQHTGTSASAPMAAGLCALVLEANPSLTWRDMQHIVVMTANPKAMRDGHWVTNGVGRKVSSLYGFGLMDAGAMVTLAEDWQTVPEQHQCTIKMVHGSKHVSGPGLSLSLATDGCKNNKDNSVMFLEHVQAKISLRYTRRGDVQMHLTSPKGTKSTLLPKRKNDRGTFFNDWPFMSTHFWGENPSGTWTLHIENTGANTNSGDLASWELVLLGTEENPVNHKKDHNIHRGDAHDKVPVTSGAPGTTTKVTCHAECKDGCHGTEATDCVACQHSKDSSTGSCVAKCPDDTYQDTDRTCLHCHASCSKCSGDTDRDCLACPPEKLYHENDGMCVNECPDGYYADNSDHTCKDCDSSCVKCSSEDTCTECDENKEMIVQFCHDKCQPDQFRDTKTKQCESCDMDCASCTGLSSNDCLNCTEDMLKQDSSCVTNCHEGFYDDGHHQCQSCHVSCKTCTGPSDNQCLECNPVLEFNAGRCLPPKQPLNCQAGQYAHRGKCVSCHPTCSSCNGQREDDCLTCPSNRYIEDGECVETCEGGFYADEFKSRDEQIKECKPCHSSCKYCNGSGSTSCTDCHHGKQIENGRCIVKCQESQYTDHRGHCKDCHDLCVECDGPQTTDCTKCPGGKCFMEGQCLADCPSDHFHKEGQCKRCHHTCGTCSGDSRHECLTCNDKFYLSKADRSCHRKPRCSPIQYFSVQDEACDTCHINCASCDGPGPKSCLTCDSTSKLIQKMCVICCKSEKDTNCCQCDISGLCKEDVSSISVLVGNPIKTNGVMLRSAERSIVPVDGWTGVIVISVVSCIVVIGFFFLIFGLMQAKTNHQLCWKHQYEKLPVRYDSINTSTMLLTSTDFVDEDDLLGD